LHKLNKTELGFILVIAAALVWSTFGLFVRALDCSPLLIIFSRYYFGFLGLLAFTVARHRLSWVKPALPYSRLILLPAICTGVSWLLYTYALNYTLVANAAFLAYTAPVFTIIFALFIIKEKLEPKSIVALSLALLGALAIMGYNTLFFTEAGLKGDIYALLAGITGGLVISYLKKIPEELPGFIVNLILSGLISIAILPFALTAGGFGSWRNFGLLVLLGLLQQAIGTTLFYTGLRWMKAQHSAILTYLDPLAATVLAALLLAEKITIGTAIGGSLIIGSGVIIVLNNRTSPALEKVRI
jgi:drug/metabolite transporter (DMT)-like permease